MTPLIAALTVVGLAWGLVADRIAARWPAHDDGAVRPIDWRTVVIPLIAGVALGQLGRRFDDAGTSAIYVVVFLALVLMLATDLDQRVLPDELSLPLAGLAAVYGLTGLNPLIGHDVPGAMLPALIGAIAIPAVFFVLSLPFGAGAFGGGDVKLLFGVGLLVGLERTGLGVVVGVLLAGVSIFALLAARRIGLKSFVPYGPFLIIGAMWAVLLQS